MASEKPAAKKAVHPMVHTVAGGLAGGIELALMYPTEYGQSARCAYHATMSFTLHEVVCSEDPAAVTE